MLRLVKPSLKYKQSFIAGQKEFQREGRITQAQLASLLKDFSLYLKKAHDYERGLNLPKGYVPASYYWLVDGSRFVGEVSLRHRLNLALQTMGGHIGYAIRPSERKKGYGKKILALSLRKAKRWGIKRALVTCNDTNVGSLKIIEANGGVLQNKIRYQGILKRRYWITIK